MGLFGNKEEKRAQEAAAKEAADRFVAMPVEELAAAMLPAFSSTQKKPAAGVLMVGQFLMSPYPRGALFIKQLLEPIREAIQCLENHGLLIAKVSNVGGSTVSITRAGEQAVANGNALSVLRGGSSD